MRRHLIISAVGEESVHREWIADEASRSFDLCLIDYGDTADRYASDAEYYFERRGFKLNLIGQLAAELADVLPRYESIWCPDDDISANTKTVNRLFELAAEYRLQIVQPAISQGDVSYQAMRQQSNYILRYTRFVEMMCPLFSREAFARVLPTFQENQSGWGLDCIWPTFFGPRDLAVLDAVGVDHTRPCRSGEVYRRFVKMGIDVKQESEDILAKYGVDNRKHHRALVRGTARHEAIDASGELVWTRPLLNLRNLLRAG